MASYLPPTEDVPIFDNANFTRNLAPLTYADAIKEFLAFPDAQGNENLQDITVYGTSDFLSVMTNQSTMPASSDSSEIVPTTAWVQGAIQNNPPTTVETLPTSSAAPLAIPLLSTSVPGVADLLVDSTNGLTYTPSTDTLACTNFTGNASTASTSTSVSISASGTNANFAVPFLSTITTPASINYDSTNQMLYNPSLNILTVPNLSGNATSASTVLASTTALNTSLPVIIGSATTGNISCLTDPQIFINPSTNTLTCPQITGNASTATTAVDAQNIIVNNAPSSATNYYLSLATTNFGASNAIVGANALRFVTNTGTLTTTILSAGTSTLSPLYNTTSGGTVRLTGTTGQYSQLQQSSAGFGYDLNVTLPNQGAFNIFTGSYNYVVPTGPNTTTSGLGIGYNSTITGGETDFVNYAGNYTTGGYNFYTLGTNTTALIGTLPRTQPAYNDSSVILPTTAWVQGAIANSGLYLPYYNYKAYGISANVLTQTTQNIIINIPQAQFTSANCSLPWKMVKIRFAYSIYDSTGAIAYSNDGVLNILPMNIVTTNVSPITPVYTTVNTGGVSLLDGSNYNFNITNGMCSANASFPIPSFNYLATYYADGTPFTTPLRNRWYWVSNQNGGTPSGFGGTSAWFNYLNYSYNGAGQYTIGINTPPYNNAPQNQGPPGWTIGTTLNMNVLYELISNDFTGSTVSFSSV